MLKNTIVVLLVAFTTKLAIANAVTTTDVPNYISPIVKVSPKTTVKGQKMTVEAPEYIKTIIDNNAEKYGLKSQILTDVIRCESSFVTNARGDNGHSRGLSQIHNLYDPDVTDEMADNPEFAVDFMAKNIASGKGSLWSCYRMLYLN